MTPDFLDYISGRMPLGILILPIVGLFFTFVWWTVWRGTGFWNRTQFWRVLAIGWALCVSAYSAVWSIYHPLPIPIRVIVNFGDPGEKVPGAWAEGVADAIRARLAAAPLAFVIQDLETAPAAFETGSKDSLDRLAALMLVKYLVAVTQDSPAAGLRPTVRIALRGWSRGRYRPVADWTSPDVSLSALAVWAGDQVLVKLGGKKLLERTSRAVHRTSEDSALARHYLSYSLRRQGQTELAAAFFSAEAAADSEWSAPRIELARTWLMAGPGLHEMGIRTALLEAARIDRKNPEVFLLLGRHFLEFRDWDEAESALKLAYYYNPDDPRVAFYLSRLMDNRLADITPKTGRGLAERALQLAPGYEAARLALIDRLRGTNDRRQAVKVVEAGLRITPHSRRLLLTASAIYLEMREYARAEVLCQRLLAEDPANPEALYNLGLCHLWLKRYDEAVAVFDSSHKCGGTVENLYYIGVTYQFKGDYPLAIEWFQKRFAAMQSLTDQGAATSRERIKMLRDWILEDSLKKAGWKPSNPFEKAPKSGR